MRRSLFTFRVGIHLGDVVEESDGDLMGDGVNIATELRRDAGSLPVVHVRQIPDGYVDPVLERGPRRCDPVDLRRDCHGGDPETQPVLRPLP